MKVNQGQNRILDLVIPQFESINRACDIPEMSQLLIYLSRNFW